MPLNYTLDAQKNPVFAAGLGAMTYTRADCLMALQSVGMKGPEDADLVAADPFGRDAWRDLKKRQLEGGAAECRALWQDIPQARWAGFALLLIRDAANYNEECRVSQVAKVQSLVQTEAECKGLQTWIQLLTPANEECLTETSLQAWIDLLKKQVLS